MKQLHIDLIAAWRAAAARTPPPACAPVLDRMAKRSRDFEDAISAVLKQLPLEQAKEFFYACAELAASHDPKAKDVLLEDHANIEELLPKIADEALLLASHLRALIEISGKGNAFAWMPDIDLVTILPQLQALAASAQDGMVLWSGKLTHAFMASQTRPGEVKGFLRALDVVMRDAIPGWPSIVLTDAQLAPLVDVLLGNVFGTRGAKEIKVLRQDRRKG